MHCVAAVWKLSSGSSESTNKVQHQLNISSKQLKDVDPRAKNRHRIAGTAKHLNVLVHVRVYNAILGGEKCLALLGQCSFLLVQRSRKPLIGLWAILCANVQFRVSLSLSLSLSLYVCLPVSLSVADALVKIKLCSLWFLFTTTLFYAPDVSAGYVAIIILHKSANCECSRCPWCPCCPRKWVSYAPCS